MSLINFTVVSVGKMLFPKAFLVENLVAVPIMPSVVEAEGPCKVL